MNKDSFDNHTVHVKYVWVSVEVAKDPLYKLTKLNNGVTVQVLRNDKVLLAS